jgi:hypothetical protein
MLAEISNILQEKAGLTPEQSQEVAQIIISQITARVPGEFQGIVGPILSGQSAAGGNAGGELGSLLGVAEGFFSHKS